MRQLYKILGYRKRTPSTFAYSGFDFV